MQGLHLSSANHPLIRFKRSLVGQKLRIGIHPSVACMRAGQWFRGRCNQAPDGCRAGLRPLEI
jgi:hypothetical protein